MKLKPDAGKRPQLIGRRDLIAMLGGVALLAPPGRRSASNPR